MAASPPTDDPARPAGGKAPPPEPGAPVPRDAIDPELVKLARTRPKIGVITAAAVVALCVYFILRIGADRHFSGEDEVPHAVTLTDVAAGKVAADSFVSLDAEPMMSHAIRVAESKGDLGHRVVPARGSSERVWLALSGDGWDKPALKAYVGRLRRVGDLPFGSVLDTHTKAHPRPAFATTANLRAAFATGQLTTVSGDQLRIADSDRVAFDVVDPGRALLVATLTGKRDPSTEDPGHGPLTDGALWIAELAKHGIPATATAPGPADAVIGQVRLEAAMSVADVEKKLEAAKLWAARVERVTQHHETTWGALRASPAGGLAVDGRTIPDAHVDLVGLFVQRGVPRDAFVLLTEERPTDYWHVTPITIALAVIGLLFAWALVRALRELLPTRA